MSDEILGADVGVRITLRAASPAKAAFYVTK